MRNILMLMVYVFGMVAGQVLFKIVANKINAIGGGVPMWQALLFDPIFYGAIMIYGLLTIYWVWLLRYVSISYAYPFVALSIAVMVFLGHFMWGEKMSSLHVLGVSLVLVGVVSIGIAGE